MNPRYRPALSAVLALIVAWLLAAGGFFWARGAKPTAAGLSEYLRTTQLGELSADARAKALARLADWLNALPAEERRKARLGRLWQPWLEQMTDEERLRFIEATAPKGFEQMLSSFEQLPPERRRAAIGDALRRMKEAGDESGSVLGLGEDGAAQVPPPALSEELRDRVTEIGLKAYYSQSSAQTKAELAPLLEELQSAMEGGRMRRGPFRPANP